jgi:hypothetical protein
LVSPPAIAWKDEGALKWALNCDFLGRDLMAVATAAEKCGGTCLSNPECSHFTWTNYQVRTIFKFIAARLIYTNKFQ